MYNFDLKLPTSKKTPGVNPCYGIVIHHTAGGSFASNMRYLSSSPKQASVHFVIGANGEAGKIGDPKDILRHAGNGSRGRTPNVNYNMLGIEVVGFGEPNQKQYDKLTDLVAYLIKTFNIKEENVVRHSDVTQAKEFTSQKILRDGKRKVKKRDIWPKFFPEGFETWRKNLYK